MASNGKSRHNKHTHTWSYTNTTGGLPLLEEGRRFSRTKAAKDTRERLAPSLQGRSKITESSNLHQTRLRLRTMDNCPHPHPHQANRRQVPSITCPTPTSVEHADIRVKSYSVNSRERYVCNSGFKRKAGTSSLTECVLNKTTNTAHWTTPNLECIRDPSLTHQRPVPFSTATPARVAPQPESPSPSGKASSPRSDTTVATETAIAPRSPSKAPSAGPTGPGRRESSRAPSQTTAGTSAGAPSASHQPPGQHSLAPRQGRPGRRCCFRDLECWDYTCEPPQPPRFLSVAQSLSQSPCLFLAKTSVLMPAASVPPC
uniref:Interleukin-15 receptor subunit alpha n=1 Tax=Propithecus coquereli TaxID=379532 RepID=A0A2K6GZL0_PROCO